jgi:hypothetical protein
MNFQEASYTVIPSLLYTGSVHSTVDHNARCRGVRSEYFVDFPMVVQRAFENDAYAFELTLAHEELCLYEYLKERGW